MSRVVLTIFLAFLLVQCSQPETPPDSPETDANSVTTGSSGSTDALEPVLTLPGSHDYFFGSITDTDLMADSSILVLDYSLKKLFRIGRDGTLLDTLASEGKGPGEFIGGLPGHLEVFPDGQIALYDYRNQRINLYDKTGAYRTSYTAPSGGWNPSINGNENGSLLLKRVPFRMGEDGTSSVEYSRFDITSGEWTVWSTIKLDEEMESSNDCAFCSWDLLDNGNRLSWARSDTSYLFFEVDAEDEIVQTWERNDVPPVRYSEEERERIEEGWVGTEAEGNSAPVYRSRFTTIMWDGNGTIWVQLNTPPEEGSTFDLFSREGEFLRRFQLEEQVVMQQFRHGYMLARTTNPTGEPGLSLYRIP